MHYDIVAKDEHILKKYFPIIEKKLVPANFHYEKNSPFVIILGGDGTLLRAIHERGFDNTFTYFMINAGSLGYHALFDINDIDLALKSLISEDYQVKTLPIFEFKTSSIHDYFINEIRFTSQMMLRNVKLDIKDYPTLLFHGTSLTISTPIGSTGYAWYNNGSYMDISLPCLQVTANGGISNQYLKGLHGNFIWPDDKEISLDLVVDKLFINNDYHQYQLNDFQEEIIISKTEKKFKLCYNDSNILKLF